MPPDNYRERFSSLSWYIKDIKQTFSRIYNRKKNRRGTLWGERFKSVIVEKGETVINCLAYIDLNAVRAGIVKRPEEYRWCSIGHHVQTGNRDDFLSLDFGLVEFGVENAQRLKKYRGYLYHAGAVKKRGKANISKALLDKENSNGFHMDRSRRFRYRSRYFTGPGILPIPVSLAPKRLSWLPTKYLKTGFLQAGNACQSGSAALMAYIP